MSKLKKVEIRIIDEDWQWMGLLSPSLLKILCAFADTLSDLAVSTEEEV